MGKQTEINTKIRVDGEREYKEACAQINSNLRLLASEMKVVSAEFAGNEKSIGGLTAKQDVLQKKYAEQNKAVQEAEKMLEQMRKAGIDPASPAYQKMETAMNSAKAEMIKTGNEIGKIKTEMASAGKTTETSAETYKRLGGEIGKTAQGYIKACGSMGKHSDEAQALKQRLTDLIKEQQGVGKATGDLAGDNKRAHASFSDLSGLLKDNVAKSITGIKANMTETGARVVEGAKSMGDSIVQFAKDTVHGENNVKALGDALREKLEERLRGTGKQLDETGKVMDDTGKSADKLGDSVKDSGKKAEDAGGGWEKFGGVLKGIGTAVAGVATAVGSAATAVGVGMYKMAESSANASREINLTSQKLGLSREGFQEWDFILRKSGTSIDVMGVSMKRLQQNMGGMTEDGDKASEAFKAVGLSFDEIKGKSPEEAFNITIKALQEMPSGADRTAAALKLFGKGAMELQPLLNKTATETDALRQRAHDLGLVLGEEQIDAGLKFRSSLGKVNDTISGLKTQLSAGLVPAFAEGLDAMWDFANGAEGGEEKMKAAVDGIVDAITNTIPEIVNKSSEMISALVEGVSGALPGIAQAISDALPQLIETITGLIPPIVDLVMTAVPSVVNALVSALPMLVEAGVQIITSLINGVSDMLPELIPVAVEAIVSIVNGLLDNLPLLLDAALQIIIGLADGLLAALPSLIKELPKIIQGVVDFLISAVPMIIEAGVQLLTSLVTALPDIIRAVVDALPQIVQGIIDALPILIPALIQGVIDLIVSLLSNVDQIVIAIVESLPAIIKGIWDGIIGIIKGLGSVLTAFFRKDDKTKKEALDDATEIAEATKETVVRGARETNVEVEALQRQSADARYDISAACNQALEAQQKRSLNAQAATLMTSNTAMEAEQKAFNERQASTQRATGETMQKDRDSTLAAMVDAQKTSNAAIAKENDTFTAEQTAARAKSAMQDVDTFKKLNTEVTSQFTKLQEAARGTLENIYKSVTNLFTKQIPEQWTAFKKNLDSRCSDVKKAMTAVADFMPDVGKRIVEGLWQGIQSQSGWLNSQVNSFTQGVKDQFTQGFEIRSPSKWADREVGENLGLGIGGGLIRTMKKVARDMQGAVRDALPSSASVDMGAGYSGTGGARSAAAPGGFGSIIVEKLIVREEADVHRIARELYNLERAERRKRGLAPA